MDSTRTYLPMKMEQTECTETSAYKIQTPGNHPKERIQQKDSLVNTLQLRVTGIIFQDSVRTAQ